MYVRVCVALLNKNLVLSRPPYSIVHLLVPKIAATVQRNQGQPWPAFFFITSDTSSTSCSSLLWCAMGYVYFFLTPPKRTGGRVGGGRWRWETGFARRRDRRVKTGSRTEFPTDSSTPFPGFHAFPIGGPFAIYIATGSSGNRFHRILGKVRCGICAYGFCVPRRRCPGRSMKNDSFSNDAPRALRAPSATPRDSRLANLESSRRV